MKNKTEKYIYITLSVTTRPSFVPFYRGQAVKEISISPLFHFLCRRFRKKEKERDARRADETVSLFPFYRFPQLAGGSLIGKSERIKPT